MTEFVSTTKKEISIFINVCVEIHHPPPFLNENLLLFAIKNRICFNVEKNLDQKIASNPS